MDWVRRDVEEVSKESRPGHLISDVFFGDDADARLRQRLHHAREHGATLAVLPEPGLAGLGNLLTEQVHRAARERGLDRVIHALQHETNTSLKITKRNARTKFRRYTLFSKAL